MHFAPTAYVTLAEFNEENGPVMLAMPIDGRNLLLAGINPDKSSRPDERVQGVVVHADVSIKRTRAIHLLKHERHFIPSFNDFRQQVCPLRTQLFPQLDCG